MQALASLTFLWLLAFSIHSGSAQDCTYDGYCIAADKFNPSGTYNCVSSTYSCRIGFGCYCGNDCLLYGDCCVGDDGYVAVCVVPRLDSINPTSSNTNGGTMTITGTQFQTNTGTVTFTYGSTPTTASISSWSDTQIICTIPAGYGQNVVVSVFAYGKNSQNTLSFDYNVPSISSVSPSTAATDGSSLITLTGSSFGANGTPITVTVDGISQTVSSHSHTQVVFQMQAGTGTSKSIVMYQVANEISNTRTISYSAPSLTSISPTNGPAAGGTTITLTGSNFGSSSSTAAVTVEGENCPITFIAQTNVRCTVPAGQGQFKQVKITVDGQSSGTQSWNYDGPTITSIDDTGKSTAGGTTITIFGTDFGTGGSVTIGSDCPTILYTDTEIRCTLPAGEGQSLTVTVTNQGLTGTYPFAYPSPSLTDIEPTSGQTQGGELLTVTGSNFGITGAVTVDGEPCTTTGCSSCSHGHTQIICLTPEGTGASNDVFVTVQGSASGSQNFAYSGPNMASITPSTADTIGGNTLTITGTNFGTSGLVTIGGSTCSPTGNGYDHTTINCVLPSGQGLNPSVVVTIDGQSDSDSTLFDYNGPTLTEISPANGPTAGGTTITFVGSSFGTTGGLATIGSSDCAITSGGQSHSQIVCTLPSGRGSTTGVASVDGVATSTSPFSYDQPSVTGISPSSAGTDGGNTVTISGASFDTAGTVTIGGTNCPVLTWSHIQITCTLPAGSGIGKDVVVTTSVTGYSATGSALFSYNAPVLSSITPTSVNTPAGTTLTITGSNFGSSQGVVSISAGGSSCTITSFSSTSMQCGLAAGEGVNQPVTVTVNGQGSNTLSFNFNGPTLSSIDPTTGQTSGGETLSLTGSNFGLTSTVTVGGVDCPVTARGSGHDTLECTIPSGQGTNKEVQVNVASQLSASLFFSYSGPTITDVNPPSGSTSGGYSVTLTGTSFGQSSATVSVAGSNCPVTGQTDSQVICTMPEGQGTGQDVQLFVGSTASNKYGFDYSAPAVSSAVYSGGDGPTEGGVTVTVTGTDFGLSATVTIGGALCGAESQSHTQILCSLPEGSGSTNALTVSVSGQTSPSVNFKYGDPNIISINPNTADTAGGVVLTLTGTNFGTTGTTTIDGEICIPTGAGYSHTQLLCVLPAGQGPSRPVQMTVDDQSFSSSSLFGYTGPTVSSVSPATGPTGGATPITLIGSSLGTSGTVGMGGTDCPVVSHSHTQVVCTLPSGRGAVDTVLTLTTGAFTQSSTPVTFTYSSPTISEVEPSEASTAGGTTLTIIGDSFDSDGTVTVGGQTCFIIAYDHSQITCTLPAGQGADQAVTVTTTSIGDVGSANLFSYSAPVLSTINPASANTDGSETLTLSGSNFGTSPSFATVLVDGSPCVISSLSHTLCQCSLPEGEGSSVLVTITVDGQLSVDSLQFSYEPPSLTSINPTSGETSGGGSITLTGTNFGLTSTVTIGGTDCPVTTRSHTQLICTIPSGQGSNKPVQVLAGGQLSGTLLFDYNGPTITDINPTTGATAGATDITLTGSSFGASGTVTVAGSTCPTVSHTDTEIVCTLPAGEGADQQVIVTVASAQSNTFLYSYTAPAITDTTLSVPAYTQGGSIVTITGTNFGTSAVVTIGGSTCTLSGGVINHAEIRCTLPVGEGTGNDLIVTVGGQSSPPDSFDYAPPIVSSISPTTGDTKGGYTLTLTGTSFGTAGSITVGPNDCPILALSHTHTEVRCAVPEGAGLAQDVVLTVASQVSSGDTFDYNAPSITSLTPTVGNTNPLTTILTLIGTNFGSDTDGFTTVGSSSCVNVNAGHNHERIECYLPAGHGTNQQVVVTANGQTASRSFSYNPPTITSLDPVSGVTDGGYTLTITGTNLGETTDSGIVSVTFGGSVDCPVTAANHETLECTVPAGSGDNVAVRVELDSQQSGELYFNYATPTVTQVASTACTTNGLGVIDCPIAAGGSAVLELTGTSFGPTSGSPTVTVGGLDCSSVSVSSHSSLTCLLPDNANGGFALPVIVTVSGVASDPVYLVSYKGPEIFANSISQFSANIGDTSSSVLVDDTLSDTEITFRGRHFYTGTSITVTFGPPGNAGYYACTVTSVGGNTEVEQTVKCDLPGASGAAGANMVFQVVDGLQTSAEGTDTISFSPPALTGGTIGFAGASYSATTHLFGTSSEGQRIKFFGERFGNNPDIVTVTYGVAGGSKNFLCSGVTGDNNELECQTEPGSEGPYVFQVDVFGAVSPEGSDKYSYPTSPIVEMVTGCPGQDGNMTYNCPTVGGTSITVLGRNFAASNISTSVKVGVETCTITAFVSSEEIHCTLKSDVGSNKPVVVIAGALFSRSVELLSFASPSVTSISGCEDSGSNTINCNRDQGAAQQTVTIVGNDFGVSDALVYFGGESCANVAHDSVTPHSRLTCDIPSGTDTLITPLIVQDGGDVSVGVSNYISFYQCPVGTYVGPDPGYTCLDCDEGSYTDSEEQAVCTECEGGRYQGSTGQSFCSVCTAGSFSVRDISTGEGATVCTDCDEGRYAAAAGLLTCSDCPLGKFGNGTGLVECTSCPAGRSTDGQEGKITCPVCAAGTYSSSEGSFTCISCIPGTFSASDGLSECVSCNPGTFQSFSGQTYCEECGIGRAASAFGTASCTDCSPGTFSNATGLDECYSCPIGSIASNSLATSCELCGSGQYIAVPGQSKCLSCPEGTHNPNEGSSTCTSCSPGSYAPNLNMDECIECLAGTFSKATGAVECVDCASGTYAAGTGNSVCGNCAAGSYQGFQGRSSCSLCPEGSAASTEGEASCSDCLGGYFANTSGFTSCGRCQPGSYSQVSISDTNGPTECAPCAPGSAIDTEVADQCISCEAGYYADIAGLGACIACPAGTHQDATGKSFCHNCTAGYFSDAQGSETCSACGIGKYSTYEGSSTCTACAQGAAQSNTGQTACISCVAGYYADTLGSEICVECPAGTYSDSLDTPSCTSCEAGRSSSDIAQTTCYECALGQYISSEGQLACLSCPQGAYANATGMSFCHSCSPGTYNANVQASNCLDCAVGKYAALSGTITCSDAPPGTFVNEEGQIAYSLCDRGYFQTLSAQESCKECAPGTYVNGQGESLCDDCPLGTYANRYNMSDCLSCPLGTHADSEGHEICDDCDPGYVAGSPGLATCDPCPAGTFYNTTGGSQCYLCPVGRYQDASGQTVCKDCPMGTATSSEGQPSCSNCLDGFYADEEGLLECKRCDIGRSSASTASDVYGPEICDPCAAGSYQNAEAQASCVLCEIGRYSTTTQQTSCADCALGRYSDFEGSSTCSNCTAGEYTFAQGAGACLTCSAGTYSAVDAAISCTDCEPGRAQPSGKQSTCLDCPAGYYTDVAGIVNCLVCPVGKYSNTTASTTCISCERGRAQSLEGTTTCVDCFLGYFAGSTGLQTCEACEPGEYAASRGQSVCDQCAPGTYAGSSGSQECGNCTRGTYSLSSGTITCSPCLTGEYNTQTGLTFCDKCSLGTYQGSQGRSYCDDCIPGYFTETTGAGSCSACNLGKFSNSTAQSDCISCDAGKYSGGTGATACKDCEVGKFTESEGSIKCEVCPGGKYTTELGTVACTQCSLGQYQDSTQQTACLDCPVGTYTSSLGTVTCSACSSGYFNNATGVTACRACSIGSYSQLSGSVGATVCNDCLIGTFQTGEGQANCDSCPVGRYSDTTGATMCTGCSIGFYADAAKSTRCLECPLGRYAISTETVTCSSCEVGKYSNILQATSCLSCSAGMYQDETGQIGCKSCFQGTFSEVDGKNLCDECPSGRWNDNTGLTQCQACGTGEYQDQTGKTSCKLCEKGDFNAITGQAVCSPCAAGRFQTLNGTTTCQSCTLGEYQDEAGQTSCKSCPFGRYSDSSDQISCTPCQQGKFSNVTGRTECWECALGKYADETGFTSCPDCPRGKTSAGVGSEQCPNCQVGRYNNETSASSCTECEIGKYQDEQGGYECKFCPGGRVMATTGAKICDSCAEGKYQDQEGQQTCINCDAGTYASTTGHAVCDPCPKGTFSAAQATVVCEDCDVGSQANQTGSQSCDACEVGRYASSTGTPACLACDPGTFSISTGEDFCELCEAGKYSGSYGTQSCDPCQPGRAQYLAGQGQCDLCEPGYFSDAEGFQICSKCPVGKFSNVSGTQTCLKCPYGTYGPTEGLSRCYDCEPGKYADAREKEECDRCPVGKEAPNNGTVTCSDCDAGHYAPDTGYPNCLPCPLGEQQPDTGMQSCEACPSGKATDSTGTIFCEACTTGKYEVDAACYPCPPGTASNVSGTPFCEDCSTGRFQNEEGKTTCIDCQLGEYQNSEGQSACVDCEAGRFSSVEATIECFSCELGTYQNETRQTECHDCFVGTYSNTMGASFCTDCASGSYAEVERTMVCLLCPFGKYADGEGLTTCENCDIGHYADSEGSPTCSQCPPGRAIGVPGAALCEECTPGQYQNNNGTTSCLDCEEGHYIGTYAAKECLPCPIGYFGEQVGLPVCDTCDAGRYTNRTGMQTCLACPNGKYSAVTTGAGGCQDCLEGYISSYGADQCELCPLRSVAPRQGMSGCEPCEGVSVASVDRTRCLCDKGYYAAEGQTSFNLCVDCPTGADCTSQGTTFETLGSLEGYWRINNRSLNFYYCTDTRDCLGGVNSACNTNKEGPLCALCVENTYENTYGECITCPDRANSWAAFILITITVVVALLAQFYIVLRQGAKLMKEEKRHDIMVAEGEEDFDEIVDDNEDETEVVRVPPHTPPPPPPNFLYKLKITLGFLQIMTNLAFSVQIPWPSMYRSFIEIFAVLNMDLVKISSVDCLFETNYYRKILFISITPVAVFAFIAIVYLFPKYLGFFRDSNAMARKRSRRRFWRLFIFAIFLIYPTVASTVLRLYVCQNLEGTEYLVEDYRIQCYTDKYNAYALYAMVMVLIYPIGIPIFIFTMLFRYRYRLKEAGVKAELGFLYHGYHHEFWWFELLDMAHKLTLVSFLAFCPDNLQLPIGMAVAVAYAMVILILRPYVRKGDDRLHLLAQNAIFMLLMTAYVFNLDEEYDPVLDVLLSLILIAITLIFFGLLVPQLLKILFHYLVTEYDWIGEKFMCLSKVRKWRERVALRTRDEEEIAEAKMVAQWKKRKDDDTDLVIQTRNPMYDPHTQAGFATKLGELTLMANPLSNLATSTSATARNNAAAVDSKQDPIHQTKTVITSNVADPEPVVDMFTAQREDSDEDESDSDLDLSDDYEESQIDPKIGGGARDDSASDLSNSDDGSDADSDDGAASANPSNRFGFGPSTRTARRER